jgi:hypothetical protein
MIKNCTAIVIIVFILIIIIQSNKRLRNSSRSRNRYSNKIYHNVPMIKVIQSDSSSGLNDQQTNINLTRCRNISKQFDTIGARWRGNSCSQPITDYHGRVQYTNSDVNTKPNYNKTCSLNDGSGAYRSRQAVQTEQNACMVYSKPMNGAHNQCNAKYGR